MKQSIQKFLCGTLAATTICASLAACGGNAATSSTSATASGSSSMTSSATSSMTGSSSSSAMGSTSSTGSSSAMGSTSAAGSTSSTAGATSGEMSVADYKAAVDKLGTDLQTVQTSMATSDVKSLSSSLEPIKTVVSDFQAITPPASCAAAHEKLSTGCAEMSSAIDSILEAASSGDTAKAAEAIANVQSSIATATTDIASGQQLLDAVKE